MAGASTAGNRSTCDDCARFGRHAPCAGRTEFCAAHRRKRRAFYQAKWKYERPGSDGERRVYPRTYDPRLSPDPGPSVTIDRDELERLARVAVSLKGFSKAALPEFGRDLSQRQVHVLQEIRRQVDMTAREVDRFLARARGTGY